MGILFHTISLAKKNSRYTYIAAFWYRTKIRLASWTRGCRSGDTFYCRNKSILNKPQSISANWVSKESRGEDQQLILKQSNPLDTTELEIDAVLRWSSSTRVIDLILQQEATTSPLRSNWRIQKPVYSSWKP